MDPRYGWHSILADPSWDDSRKVDRMHVDNEADRDTHQVFGNSKYEDNFGPSILRKPRMLWKQKFVNLYRTYHKKYSSSIPTQHNSFPPPGATAPEATFPKHQTSRPRSRFADRQNFMFAETSTPHHMGTNDVLDKEGNLTPLEVDRFFKIGSVDKAVNPFEWWKNNAASFPIIALMARDILAIPSSSAEPERVFSQARTVLDWNQARMISASIQACVYVKCYALYNDYSDIPRFEGNETLDLSYDADADVI